MNQATYRYARPMFGHLAPEIAHPEVGLIDLP